jgi:beta-lactamase superfamily II metal-dependent hydrolase
MKPLTLLACCIGLFLIHTCAMGAKQDGRLDIYWIDVEGGAATLMVTPEDECVLIDTGNPGVRDARRIGHVVGEVARLRAIDHLIVTHYHGDHYGGAVTLASMLPIRNMYDNGVFDGMPDNPGSAYFALPCETRQVIQPGNVIELRQAAQGSLAWRLQCLGARQSFVAPQTVNAVGNEELAGIHQPKDRDGSDNANSIVMLLSFGAFQFFDAGDLTWNQEARLVAPFNLVGEVDVYQVTHHGLDSSNNPVVLASLKPRVAIMNNGDVKGCMPEVFANLKATPSLEAIYQIHKNLRPDGQANNVPDDFIANKTRASECQGHYIKLSVAPDGQSYTVSIPAHQHERTYQTK